MAKKVRTRTRTITKTVRAPTPVIRVSAPVARFKKHAKRHYTRARGAAGRLLGATQPQITAVAGAALLGLLQKQGVKIPKLLSSLSTPANAGLIAYAAGKLMRNQTLDHLATGMLSVAAWAYTGGAPIDGDDSVLGTGVVYDDDAYYGYDYQQ